MKDCSGCSHAQTALNVERTDLLRAKAAEKAGRLDPQMVNVHIRRVLAARTALENHQQECGAWE